MSVSVMTVDQADDDYRNVKDKLMCFKETNSIPENDGFSLLNCEIALKVVTEDWSLPKSLSSFLCPTNSSAYNILKDATSPLGVTTKDLAVFATAEIRILKLEQFVKEKFSAFVLRERQDSRVRYEVNNKSLRISSIFSSIEENKSHLRLADYGVSQTSLEQVFNLHAAEAEQQKTGRIDHEPAMDCMTAESSVEQIDARLSLHEVVDPSHHQNASNNDLKLPYDEGKLKLDTVIVPFDERYAP
jgi:hypothetical protein